MAKSVNVNPLRVSPRDGQVLSRIINNPQTQTATAESIFQLLLGEIASLRQQVNNMALSRVVESHPVELPRIELPEPEPEVDTRKMRRMFD